MLLRNWCRIAKVTRKYEAEDRKKTTQKQLDNTTKVKKNTKRYRRGKKKKRVYKLKDMMQLPTSTS